MLTVPFFYKRIIFSYSTEASARTAPSCSFLFVYQYATRTAWRANKQTKSSATAGASWSFFCHFHFKIGTNIGKIHFGNAAL